MTKIWDLKARIIVTCHAKGAVYTGVCLLCDSENCIGVYVGETALTLGVRANEHILSSSVSLSSLCCET